MQSLLSSLCFFPVLLQQKHLYHESLHLRFDHQRNVRDRGRIYHYLHVLFAMHESMNVRGLHTRCRQFATNLVQISRDPLIQTKNMRWYLSESGVYFNTGSQWSALREIKAEWGGLSELSGWINQSLLYVVVNISDLSPWLSSWLGNGLDKNVNSNWHELHTVFPLIVAPGA